jgi:hypothetical protein
MTPPVYGLMAEFESASELVAATRRAYAEGYRRMDAYSPFPVEGLAESLGVHKDRVALVTLAGGILGGTGAYALQYWINKIAYPLNIGGRPFHAWPAFIIVTFEMTVLFGGISALFGMLALNGLPLPHHPTFNAPGFEKASRDGFFLCIESIDPQYEPLATRTFLEGLNPARVVEVPN